MNAPLKQIAEAWPAVRDALSVPHSEKEYLELRRILDALIEEVGEDESHPLSSLMETLGSLLELYESQNTPEMEGGPLEALRTLMEEHGLTQSDMPEIGSQGVVSEILSGKRQLNVRQIKLLSKRFSVSPSVFV